MCGIAGFLLPEGLKQNDIEHVLHGMTRTLTHRGPDGSGTWSDPSAGVALGHRRLSIIDLSAEGRQPMRSSDGRYVIVYNGEVYNFRTLRKELEALGHSFRGHSDTEVMLAAVCEWGIEAAVRRFIGMFAFALWDTSERRLYLVRDRIGIKPLYYGWANRIFLFGSELKALRAHPEFRHEIDRNALALYFRHNYIPAPYSIYRNVHKLMPGTILGLSPNGAAGEPVSYWSLKTVVEDGFAQPRQHSQEEALRQLDCLLRDAVKLHMESDVPLGAFLSGGIDSTTVVALMQAQSGQPVKTFTIGFCEDEYNEAQEAKAVAQHLGTDHTELYVTPDEARAVIPRLPVIYDEPFSDSSQIPTFLVSELARRHVKVSLSGDGGDESFFGYRHYLTGRHLWKRIAWLPYPARRLLGKTVLLFPDKVLDGGLGWIRPLMARYGGEGNVSQKARRLAEMMVLAHWEAVYRSLVSHWKQPASLVIDSREPPTVHTDPRRWAELSRIEEKMMYLDMAGYLPDDILVKVDRASMGVSLEARVPLLDHRVVEFAWRIPLNMKFRDGDGKWLLRRLLRRYVPGELIDRPKMGFGVPVGRWLRGPLRDWAESLLNAGRLKSEGYLQPQPIRLKWMEHIEKRRNWSYYLWDVLMFQAWYESQV